MSTQVTINQWDGGHAEDLRTHNTNESEKSLNFDIFTNPHKLIPYGDSVAETASSTMSDVQISDVEVSLIGSTYIITGSGYESSGSSKPTFYTKSDMVATFSSQAVAAGNTYQKGSLVVYKDKAFALGFNGSNQYSLYRYDSAGTVTTIGTISSSSTFRARPFVHPEDNILYITIGTVITKWDGTTLTSYSSILPSGMEPTSLTDYGTYLAIATRPLRNNGNSTVYLWGRDGTINTLQGSIDFGEGNLLLIENLDNNLIAVMTPQTSYSASLNNRIIVKGYAGGAVETLKSVLIGSTLNAPVTKVKNGGRLYFAFGNDDAVYAFGKNKTGRYILTKDRYLYNGTATGSLTPYLSMIGDIMWRGINSTYALMRSKISALGESITYSSTSLYKTTINPSMGLSDRYDMKKLDSVKIAVTGVSSGTVKVRYYTDGGSVVDIISETTTAAELVYEANVESDGVPLAEGREFQFQIETTGGVMVKELSYYYTVTPTLN